MPQPTAQKGQTVVLVCNPLVRISGESTSACAALLGNTKAPAASPLPLRKLRLEIAI
jgi:hypothetical protein